MGLTQERTLRDMVRTLREFEGSRCLWRAPVAGMTLLLIRGLPVAGAVVVALMTIKGRILSAALAAIIVLLFDAIRRRLETRLPWRAVVANRLWTFEKPNPVAELEVLVREEDVSVARRTLRRAKFNPLAYGLRLAASPNDAPELNHKLRVQEPAAWMQSRSEDDRVQRVASALKRAQVKARVGGIDTF